MSVFLISAPRIKAVVKFNMSEERKTVKNSRSGLDPCLAWVLRRACCIFGVRREKSEKLQQNFASGGDDNSFRQLHRFLGETDVPVCFLHLASSGEALTASVSELPTPAQLKKKVIAMVRVQPEAEITADSIGSSVVLIELAKGVMDMLNVYCHSVYLSMLTNRENQRGWSDLISKDLMDKYHVFLANLHVTVGLIEGKTLLPLPPREAVQDVTSPSAAVGGVSGAGGSSSSSAVSRDRVHVLEGAVITWTKQIRHVLKQEPEHVFRDGQNPEPIAEIHFWRNRKANLNSIHAQLQMEGVKKVLKFLEANKSTYTMPFSRLQKEVEDAREEANDNVRFLKHLGADPETEEMALWTGVLGKACR